MKNLPTSVLRTFVTIVEEGGFTQAAAVLNLTQPTVSQQIKKLEELVEQPLLDRGQRRLELTVAGQTMLDYARRILMLNDQAVATIAMPAVKGRLRLGIPHEFTLSILPELVGAFSQAHPDVVVEVDCELSKNLLANLKDYDLVIALHDPAEKKSGARLRSEPLVWVSSLEYALDSQKPLRIIAAPDPCIYRANMLRVLEKYRAGWSLQLTSTSYSAVCAAVSTGMGVTVLAESVVPGNLKILETSKLKKPGKVDLRLHHDRTRTTEATKTFVDFVHQRYRQV